MGMAKPKWREIVTAQAKIGISREPRTLLGFSHFQPKLKNSVTTQASYFSNAKHTILSPEGGENSVFRGKY